MADRYKRLWTGTKNLYQNKSPVIIAATALLHDLKNNNVVAQIKFFSISYKTIKAIKIRIVEHDTVGRILGEPIEYQYLDLAIYRNTVFGQKKPVLLKNMETRSFEIFVVEVAFDDNTLWKSTSERWMQLPSQRSLGTVICDTELLKQYRMKYGLDSEYEPMAINDLWFCKCGAVNHDGEENCSKCGSSRKEIFDVDIENLKTDCDERLKAESALIEAHRVQEEETKNKKIKFSVTVGVALVVIIVFISILTNVIIPSNKYNRAEKLSEKGDYDGAIAIFQELGDYKDCNAQVSYQEALKLLSEKDYISAIHAFEKLEDYKDSKNKKQESEEAGYQQAIKYLSKRKYADSYSLFDSLEYYKDSKEYLSHFYRLPVHIERTEDNLARGSGSGINNIEYDDLGYLCSIENTHNGSSGMVTKKYADFKHDKKGRILEYSEVSSDDNVKYKYKYKYQSNGCAVKTNDKYKNNYYSFDEYGNRVKHSYFLSGEKVTVTDYHTLDEFGNPTFSSRSIDGYQAYRRNYEISYYDDLPLRKKFGTVTSFEIRYGYYYYEKAIPNAQTVIENLKRMDIID